MKLPDRLQALDTVTGAPVGEPVPAYVGSARTTAELVPLGQGFNTVYGETPAAIVRPTALAIPGRRWTWNDEEYTQPTWPVVHSRNGKPHHYTIQLERRAI